MAGDADQNAGSEGRAVWDEARLLAHLETLAIAWTIHRHPPLFSVDDSQSLRGTLPGAHVKNMFLKDKKGALWLATCLEDRRIRIRDLEKTLGAQKMSFAKPELLWEALGVKPGAVTPFALLNDDTPDAIPEQSRGRVRFAIDMAIDAATLVNCHPLHNEATIALTPADLRRVVTEAGHALVPVDFDALEAQAAAREAAQEP